MKKISVISGCINKAISIVKSKAKGPLQETGYNAAMAVELPTLLNKRVGLLGNAHFGGCYIHQSPRASYFGPDGKTKTCEVGDLLTIYHQVVNGYDYYNAALIQWKIMKTGKEILSGPSLIQLNLYRYWHKFSLSSKGGSYDITPKSISPGAQYGLIIPTSQMLYTTCPKETLEIVDSVSFARFILNLMKWQTGRPFDLDSQNENDEWSQFVSALIRASLAKVFTSKYHGQVNVPRTSKDILNMIANKGLTLKEVEEKGEDENEAISILYISLSEETTVSSNIAKEDHR